MKIRQSKIVDAQFEWNDWHWLDSAISCDLHFDTMYVIGVRIYANYFLSKIRQSDFLFATQESDVAPFRRASENAPNPQEEIPKRMIFFSLYE